MPAAPTSPGEPEGTFLQCPLEDGQAEIQLLSSLSFSHSLSLLIYWERGVDRREGSHYVSVRSLCLAFGIFRLELSKDQILWEK